MVVVLGVVRFVRGGGGSVLQGAGVADVLNALDGVADSVLDTGDGADGVKRDRVDPGAS